MMCMWKSVSIGMKGFQRDMIEEIENRYGAQQRAKVINFSWDKL